MDFFSDTFRQKKNAEYLFESLAQKTVPKKMTPKKGPRTGLESF